MAIRLGRKKRGGCGEWLARSLPGVIRLPGSVDEAGVVTNTERPTLMRLYRPHKYTGVAWFQRTIEAPAAWRDRHVRLFLERCHWETQVWVDEQHVGMRDSLCVPHEYDLGQLSPGPHRLTIRVDNHLKYNMGWQSLGPNMLGLGSHMLSEDTQTNWNGIVGRMELAAAAPLRIADAANIPGPGRECGAGEAANRQCGEPAGAGHAPTACVRGYGRPASEKGAGVFCRRRGNRAACRAADGAEREAVGRVCTDALPPRAQCVG